jgi:Domain of unknown function (DUF4362)
MGVIELILLDKYISRKAENYVRLLFIGVIFLLFLITGCQTTNQTTNYTTSQEEVINKHGDIENLERLKTFVNNLKEHNLDKIDFVEYGIEGQKGIRTLNYTGEQIKVSHSVDGEFIEEYSCKGINVEKEERKEKYILIDCTGNFIGEIELLSVPTNNN